MPEIAAPKKTRKEHRLAESPFVRKQAVDFANQLREWRASKGYTLAQVANMTGVTVSQIANLEAPGASRSRPSFAVLMLLCKAMGVSVPKEMGE